jgi:hypothetical protein
MSLGYHRAIVGAVTYRQRDPVTITLGEVHHVRLLFW